MTAMHLDLLTPAEEHEALADFIGGASWREIAERWGISDRTFMRDLESGRCRVTFQSLREHAGRKRLRQPPKHSTDMVPRPITPADSETGLETLIREFGDLRLFLIESITELRKHGDHRGTILGVKALMDLLERAQTLSERAREAQRPTEIETVEARVLSYQRLREELTR